MRAASWRQLASPYEGSFFGVLPLGADAVLAYGLRGNLYRSENGGVDWHKIASATLAMLDGGTRWGEAGVVLVGLSGVVLVSRDGGRTFTLLQQADHSGSGGDPRRRVRDAHRRGRGGRAR